MQQLQCLHSFSIGALIWQQFSATAASSCVLSNLTLVDSFSFGPSSHLNPLPPFPHTRAALERQNQEEQGKKL